jgi:hypothetical protein
VVVGGSRVVVVGGSSDVGLPMAAMARDILRRRKRRKEGFRLSITAMAVVLDVG